MDGIYIGFDNHGIGTIWPPDAGAREGYRIDAPSHQRAFGLLFRPLLPLMGSLYWFAARWESTPFYSPTMDPADEAKLDSLMIAYPKFEGVSTSLFRPGVLPDFAHWLRDDWVDLLGFAAADEVNAKQMADEFSDAEVNPAQYYGLIEHHVGLCFFCMDGVSWEFYCAKPSLVDQVYEHVRHTGELRVARRALRDRDRR